MRGEFPKYCRDKIRRRAAGSAASLYKYTVADLAPNDDTLGRRCHVVAMTLEKLR